MKVLLLGGWFSGGRFKNEILSRRYEVCCPKLSNFSFKKAVRQAQAYSDWFQPDIIVGSSRGGAVAAELNYLYDNQTPMILLAPAWKLFGKATKAPKNSVVIHGIHDKAIHISDSFKFAHNEQIIAVDDGHSLNGHGLGRVIGIIDSMIYRPFRAKKGYKHSLPIES